MKMANEARSSFMTREMPLGICTWMLALCAVLILFDLIAVKAGGFTLRFSCERSGILMRSLLERCTEVG